MKFVDINTFYCPKAGGIKTYHQAKLRWFAQHPEHHYVLIHGGSKFLVTKPAVNVRIIQVFAIPLGKDPDGYRLIFNFFKIWRLLKHIQPDVLEAGDPWLTGLFSLWIKWCWKSRVLVSSFYHSDPIRTYLIPYLENSRFPDWIATKLTKFFSFLFYRLQNKYALTLVSSQGMEDHLRLKKLRRIWKTPFGVAREFFLDTVTEHHSSPRDFKKLPLKLLYSGRLDREKGVDLLLEMIHKVNTSDHFELTIVGRGAYSAQVQALTSKRVRYLGYVKESSELIRLYHSHHLFFAPGPYETFGLAVLEALATGLIVIGPDQGGTGEILREVDKSLLFVPFDFDSGWQTLDYISRSDLATISKKCRRVAERYGDWDSSISRMVSTYVQAFQQGYLT